PPSTSPSCDHNSPTLYLTPLSLHDALPISSEPIASTWASLRRVNAKMSRSGTPRGQTSRQRVQVPQRSSSATGPRRCGNSGEARSEEHTSELQSHLNLVCRLLLEKKTNNSK